MGAACCGRANNYPEIDEAASLSDLVAFLQEKQTFISKQAEEIEDYIQDKGKIPKSIEIASIQDEHLRKRIDYLEGYNNAVGQAVDILKDNPRMNLLPTKEAVHQLWDYFFVEFDDLKAYSKSVEELKTIAG